MVEEIGEGPQRWSAYKKIADRLIRKNPDAAIVSIEKMPEKAKVQALASLGYQWAMHDPEAATKWALSLTSSPTFTSGHLLPGENSLFVGFSVQRSAPQAGGAAFVF